MLIEALGMFLFYDFIFLAFLILMGILEHFEKVRAKKKAKAIRKARVKQAKIEYLKMIS